MKLPVSFLAPGMRLTRPIYGPKGELLLNRGVELTARYILALRRYGVLAAYVENPVGVDVEEAQNVLSEEVRIQTMKAVRAWVESGKRLKEFGEIVVRVREIVDEILQGKVCVGGLAEICAADSYTFAHSVDVCALAVAAGVKLGYPRPRLLQLGVGSLLHDVGKAKVPPEVLNKPGRLTDEEFAVMKKHPLLGYKLLCMEVDGKVETASLEVVLNHHERYDGSGYPRGLKGEEMGEMAMVCAAADVYNAMTTDRVYRKAHPPHEAYEMLAGGGGVLLSLRVIQAFLSCVHPYPPGTLVRLSTGEVACVVSADPDFPFRPRVALVPSGEVVELKKALSVVVTGPLPAEEVREFLVSGRVSRAAAETTPGLRPRVLEKGGAAACGAGCARRR